MSDRKIKFSIDTSASPEPDMFMPPDPLRKIINIKEFNYNKIN